VVIISIVAFSLFDCEEYHSEFLPLEATRHTPLTDRMSLQYYELPKLPETVNAENMLQLWLKLFDADTEEELRRIEETEAPIMKQAINAYRGVTAAEEFRTLERMRSDARRNEASALANARREGAAEATEKWQDVLAEKDATLAEQTAALAERTAALAEQAARIAELEALLGKDNRRQ
jgi:predicted transposase/invertase (TIGR01784 family)